MNDILSQIIAYAPNKIDTETKARALAIGPRAMVGEITDEQTQFGKPIYQTPAGEKVSEKSTTLFFNGDWMNVPSIHGGKSFNEDELRLMIKQGNIEPTSVHKSKDDAEAAAKARSDSMVQGPRNMYNQGQLVSNTVDGSRPGYSGKYGPNIRKLTQSDTLEVQIIRGGTGGGKGGQKFYKTFNFEDYGSEENALKAAKEYRESIPKIKKDTGKQSKGLPIGFKKETGGQAEIRKILKEIIEVGGKSFSNEDIRQLIDTDLFPDDDQFRKAVDVVKKEPEFKNLTFEKKPRPRLKNDPVSVLMAKTKERRDKKINILGSKDYEKELYKYKKEIQEALGLEKYKTSGSISGKPRELLPIEMGHQSSIKQLSLLKQKMRPEDLSPQNYEVNRKGVKKNKGGVQTLEDNLNKKFYPEQKKLYIQAKKFIDAGKIVPADLQNKIITLNEDIQKFVDNTVKKYPLLKDRVNPITIDANDLTVKRGNNVFKQLGIGLVDQNLGDIKIGSIDDLTIKANLAQQTFKEAVDAGLIDEIEGQKKLNKFLNSRPILRDAVNDAVGELACGNKLASGGRIKFNSGSSCNVRGRKILTDAMRNGISSIEPSKQNLVKRILSGSANLVKGVLDPKEFFKLKNLIGFPAAVAAVAYDTVMVADDMIRKGQPFDEAAGNEMLAGMLNLQPQVQEAKRVLADPKSSLSPAAKKYAEMLVDIGEYNNTLQTKDIPMKVAGMPGDPKEQEMLQKKLEALDKKISNTSTSGELDYLKEITERDAKDKAGSYVGEGGNEYGYTRTNALYDDPDKTDAPSFFSGQLKPSYGDLEQKPGQLPGYATKMIPAYVSQNYKTMEEQPITKDWLNVITQIKRKQGELGANQNLDDIKYMNERFIKNNEGVPTKQKVKGLSMLDEMQLQNKWMQALSQPGIKGTQFSEGGITELRSKYEYKK